MSRKLELLKRNIVFHARKIYQYISERLLDEDVESASKTSRKSAKDRLNGKKKDGQSGQATMAQTNKTYERCVREYELRSRCCKLVTADNDRSYSGGRDFCQTVSEKRRGSSCLKEHETSKERNTKMSSRVRKMAIDMTQRRRDEGQTILLESPEACIRETTTQHSESSAQKKIEQLLYKPATLEQRGTTQGKRTIKGSSIEETFSSDLQTPGQSVPESAKMTRRHTTQVKRKIEGSVIQQTMSAAGPSLLKSATIARRHTMHTKRNTIGSTLQQSNSLDLKSADETVSKSPKRNISMIKRSDIHQTNSFCQQTTEQTLPIPATFVRRHTTKAQRNVNVSTAQSNAHSLQKADKIRPESSNLVRRNTELAKRHIDGSTLEQSNQAALQTSDRVVAFLLNTSVCKERARSIVSMTTPGENQTTQEKMRMQSVSSLSSAPKVAQTSRRQSRSGDRRSFPTMSHENREIPFCIPRRHQSLDESRTQMFATENEESHFPRERFLTFNSFFRRKFEDAECNKNNVPLKYQRATAELESYLVKQKFYKAYQALLKYDDMY